MPTINLAASGTVYDLYDELVSQHSYRAGKSCAELTLQADGANGASVVAVGSGQFGAAVSATNRDLDLAGGEAKTWRSGGGGDSVNLAGRKLVPAANNLKVNVDIVHY
ncbi:MAG: hypothetical protein M3416_05420 [Acidobacteriota bacterium]|nr:hypothetical protein [Acidobacteriota bacterium]